MQNIDIKCTQIKAKKIVYAIKAAEVSNEPEIMQILIIAQKYW